MGVKVHRKVETLPEGCHQAGCCRRPQQPCHVLDGQDVGTGGDDPLREPQIVIEGIGPLGRIQQVRGIAERDLRHRRGLVDDRVDGGTHLLHIVQGIEDAEDVHPGLGCLRDESPSHLRRVGGVADGVAAAQQHLQILVRHRGPELGQPLPWVLAEESQRDVVGGTTPTLDGEQARQQPRLPRGHRHQVAGAHTRRQQ